MVVFEDLLVSVGLTPVGFITILIILSSFLLSAKDWRLGVIFMFLLSSVSVPLAYLYNWNYPFLIYLSLFSFALLSLSLLVMNESKSGVM